MVLLWMHACDNTRVTLRKHAVHACMQDVDAEAEADLYGDLYEQQAEDGESAYHQPYHSLHICTS